MHRDLKPDNVMITKDKSLIKIIDFGLAIKLGDPYNDAGTRIYMSPEQLKVKVHLSTDMWAYGCILLELFTN